MSATRILVLALMAATICVTGCQTSREGVRVDVGALLQAYRARLDRKPGRAEVERIVAALKPEQLNDMGVVYEREGRLEEAAWAYQHAIWRSPRFAPAYVNLGNVLRTQGRWEEALSRYRQAMSAAPDSFEAANNFADLCAEKRVHLDEAIGLLAPAVARPGPHRPYGLDTLGWLHHLRGDDAEAAEVLEQALREADPADAGLIAALHGHLADVCAALGRDADAARHEAEARRAMLRSSRPDASEGSADSTSEQPEESR